MRMLSIQARTKACPYKISMCGANLCMAWFGDAKEGFCSMIRADQLRGYEAHIAADKIAADKPEAKKESEPRISYRKTKSVTKKEAE